MTPDLLALTHRPLGEVPLSCARLQGRCYRLDGPTLAVRSAWLLRIEGQVLAVFGQRGRVEAIFQTWERN
jgi:hypothetical protein